MIFRTAGRPLLKDPWICPLLNRRVEILEASQSEATLGGLIQDYISIKTIWGGVKSLGEWERTRYSNTEKYGTPTHQFVFRYRSLEALNGSTAIISLTSNHYLKLLYSDETEGRLFRVRSLIDGEENKEFIRVIAEEIEETDTGFSGSIF